MKTFLRILVPGLLILVFAVTTMAQERCTIPPGSYRTQTQGGWGTACRGGNPGCIRNTYFGTAFPAGLTVGGLYTIHFSSSAAIDNFLPAGGTPNILTGTLTNPTSSSAGVFAGQVTTLAISVGFGDAGVPGFANLRNLVIVNGSHSPNGPCAGFTVGQILALANDVLGGNLAALPTGITLSDLNSIVDAINNNFDNGTVSQGYLAKSGCDFILPVALLDFSIADGNDGLVLRWTTASESHNDYFDVARNGTRIGSIATLGNDASGHEYEFVDHEVQSGRVYTYTLVCVDLNGTRQDLASRSMTAGTETAAVSHDFTLHQNYPNPFNPSTTISFKLPEAGFVQLSVYDLAGRVVANLVNKNLGAASHTVTFDASGLSSGKYSID